MTPLLLALSPSTPLANPLPGGFVAGYAADTGLDLAGFMLPVRSLAAGVVEYAERGHTRWRGRGDSPFSVRVRLDVPRAWRGRCVTHAYYGHLSALAVIKAEGAPGVVRVEAGARLGTSGFANGSPHLHLGLLLDGDTSQAEGTFLREAEIRELLGGLVKGARLPRGEWLAVNPSTSRQAGPPTCG